MTDERPSTISAPLTRRNLFRLAGAGALAAGTLPLLQACGGDDAPAGATSQAEKLIIANAQGIPTLDPDLTAADAPASVIMEICEPLIDFDAGKRELVPRLAESWSFADPTTFELKLRQNVTFSNGEPFDADAVKFTFARTADPATKTVNTAFANVTSVDAVDAHTVRLKLKAPDALLTQLLATYPMLPPKHTAQVGTGLATNLVGTGPYKLKTFTAGYEVVLERNEGYWGTKPAYREATYRTIEAAETQLSALASGQIHIAAGLLPQQAKSLSGNPKIKIISMPKMLMAYIALDAAGRTAADSPMTNKLVRQALNYAVDVDSIIKNLLLGYGTRIGSVAHPSQFGYDADIKPYTYDPARAKDLLAQAGYPNGFEARMISQSAGIVAQAEAAQAVARDLEKVGVKVTLQTMTDPTAVGQVVRGGKAGPMFQFGNAARGVFDVAAGLSSFQTGNAFSYYASDEFMRLYQQQLTLTDAEARKPILSQLQRLMHDDAPVLFQWAVHAIWAVSTDVDWPGDPGRYNRLYIAKPK
ncbi:ABC transporter substrate-binding protein [Dactylosporangium sp. CA-092794]|uniref:ABC transporter substrate-binding protein n=1 Tax=Dactylosporangium sp. CA-092794 TaxID=3239929 RepID=UPI003D8A0053